MKKLKEWFKKNTNKILSCLFALPLVIGIFGAVFGDSCQLNNSADVPIAYADAGEQGLEYYEYSYITGYVALESESSAGNGIYTIQNTSGNQLFLLPEPLYTSQNQFVYIQLQPFIWYNDVVVDDSLWLNFNVTFYNQLPDLAVDVTFICEYYSEGDGTTPIVEKVISYDGISPTYSSDNLFRLFGEQMGWDVGGEQHLITSMRIIFTASGIADTWDLDLNLLSQPDNFDVSYAGYMFELSDYLQQATADVTIVPVVDQIAGSLNSLMSIELLPGFTIQTLLIMALIIPLVIVISKLWFGG